ncbi:MAG TPA: hypothetical protein VIL69_17765, partial [Roseomonas sp.]
MSYFHDLVARSGLIVAGRAAPATRAEPPVDIIEIEEVVEASPTKPSFPPLSATPPAPALPAVVRNVPAAPPSPLPTDLAFTPPRAAPAPGPGMVETTILTEVTRLVAPPPAPPAAT